MDFNKQKGWEIQILKKFEVLKKIKSAANLTLVRGSMVSSVIQATGDRNWRKAREYGTSIRSEKALEVSAIYLRSMLSLIPEASRPDFSRGRQKSNLLSCAQSVALM